MDPRTVEAIISAAADHWTFANDVEVTLEANPSSVEATRFSAYREAGINRVSIGVQALNDTDLRRLGRLHTVREAREAFNTARHCFDRVSFDLIYARQDQSLAEWEAELTEALRWGPDHLSLYQLTIEDGTAFGDRYKAGRLLGLPGEDLAADMYDLTQSLCDESGLVRYEVSNHARPGSESRHNRIYWRYGDYVGIGPGAHGRLSFGSERFATVTESLPAEWLGKVASGSGEIERSRLSLLDCGDEYLMMGLRMPEGIDTARYQDLSGRVVDPKSIGSLSDLGMISLSGTNLSVTNQGVKVLNAVIRELLTS